MVADHPLLSSAGTDNEAQGEVTERTDSHFPLRHDIQQKKSIKGKLCGLSTGIQSFLGSLLFRVFRSGSSVGSFSRVWF